MSEWLCDENANKKQEVPVKPKNPVGRSRKSNPQMTIASMATSNPLLDKSIKRSRGSRGSYINWFTDYRWPQITAVVKKYRNLSTTLHSLKVAYKYSLVILCFQAFHLNIYV